MGSWIAKDLLEVEVVGIVCLGFEREGKEMGRAEHVRVLIGLDLGGNSERESSVSARNERERGSGAVVDYRCDHPLLVEICEYGNRCRKFDYELYIIDILLSLFS